MKPNSGTNYAVDSPGDDAVRPGAHGRPDVLTPMQFAYRRPMATEESAHPPTVRELIFPMIWLGVDEEPLKYATQALIQFDGSAFQVSFGVVTPPVLAGGEAEREAMAEHPPTVYCRPVSRVVLPPAAAKDLNRILTELLQAVEREGGATS